MFSNVVDSARRRIDLNQAPSNCSAVNRRLGSESCRPLSSVEAGMTYKNCKLGAVHKMAAGGSTSCANAAGQWLH